jgi:hypothetical protein
MTSQLTTGSTKRRASALRGASFGSNAVTRSSRSQSGTSMPRRSRSPALSNSQRHACSATDVRIPYPKGRLQGRPSLCTPGMGSSLGCESPVEEMTLTTSQRQLRHREVAWEGSPRRSRDLRDTNRIQGGAAVWASRQRTTKPVVIEGPQRKCGRCATKVAVLIRGDLHGCPGCPTITVVGWERTAGAERCLFVVEKSAEAIVVAVAATKGRTQSRGAARPCSWSPR